MDLTWNVDVHQFMGFLNRSVFSGQSLLHVIIYSHYMQPLKKITSHNMLKIIKKIFLLQLMNTKRSSIHVQLLMDQQFLKKLFHLTNSIWNATGHFHVFTFVCLIATVRLEEPLGNLNQENNLSFEIVSAYGGFIHPTFSSSWWF